MANTRETTVLFFKDIYKTLKVLPDAEAGLLMRALFAVANKENPVLPEGSMAAAVFPLAIDQMERLEEYRNKQAQKRINRNQAESKEEQTGNKKEQNGTNEEQNGSPYPCPCPDPYPSPDPSPGHKEKGGRFAPPTVNDVKDYAWENGYKIDAERFVDFYTSKGWMVGKSKMKDWKAAVRNWAARDKKEALPFEDLDAGDFKVWEAI
jgi:hypothetical protein